MAGIGRKRVAKQDVSYPDWGRVIVKKDKPGAKIASFNPEKLMRILKGMKDVSVVKMRIWDTSTAARLDGITEDGRKVMTLVMPIVDH
jgi:hypothetical protein